MVQFLFYHVLLGASYITEVLPCSFFLFFSIFPYIKFSFVFSEASKYGTSDETGRERSDSDVYLKPKSLTMSKSSDYSGLQSGERTQPGIRHMCI